MAKVFVQNSNGHDINIYDEVDNWNPLGRISLGAKLKPDYIAVSKNNALLYTNWVDLSWRERGYGAAAQSYFTAHDAATFEEVWRVEMPVAINHWAMDPSGRYAFNSVVDRPQMIRVDLQTQSIDSIKVNSLGGHGIKVSKDGRFCYGASILTGDFWEIDTSTLEMSRLFGFFNRVRPFTLSVDGKYAFVQISGVHGFHKFNLETWNIEDTIELPENPPDTPRETKHPFTVDHGIAITPDEQYIVCLATTANEVYILDYPGFSVVKRIKVGTEPSYLTFNPQGNRLYVSSRVTDELHVIDLETLEIAHHQTAVGRFPQRIAVGA